MAAKDEEDGNVSADGNPAESSEIEMHRLLEEIHATEMDHLPRDHEVESNLGKKKETTGSCSLGVDRSIQTISDQETQGTSNQQLAVSSGTSNVPVSSGETSREPCSRFLSRFKPSSDATIDQLYGSDLASNYKLPDDEEVTNSVDPRYSASSSSGPRPQISMTQAFITSTDFVPPTRRNQQPMNPHYSSFQVPSGQYGYITNYPFMPPNQNQTYYLPPSAAIQQQGGSNMVHYGNTYPNMPPNQNQSNYLPPPVVIQRQGGSNMAHHGNMMTPPYWRPEQHGIYNLPPFQQQGGSNIAHHGNMMNSPYRRPEQYPGYIMPQIPVYFVPYPYGYVNLFGTWTDNPAKSRFGNEGGVSSNQLPHIQQHQGGDLDVWRPSSSQLNALLATLNQQDDRSDPSDQTQQRLGPRDH